MEKNEILKYWLNSSDVDSKAMENLFDGGHYIWALFLSHLVVEKSLKAYYAENVDIDVPRIHDLLKIAQKGHLQLTEEQMDF